MASQTVMTLCSSSTPKLATFKSPTPTLLPLPPLRTFSCSSSLATPCLKASCGGSRVLQKSQDFKCHASSKEMAETVWEDIQGAEKNQEVQSRGEFAVNKHNEDNRTKIIFQGVTYAQMQIVAAGVNYRLEIKGTEDNVEKLFRAVVHVSAPVYPMDLKSFARVEWGR